jgi:hypothetical protein
MGLQYSAKLTIPDGRQPSSESRIPANRQERSTMPHRIRLRGPWEFEPRWRWARDEHGGWQQSSTDLPPGGTFMAPQRWSDVLGAGFRGCVRLSRRFHRPTGLEATSKLWLVVGDLAWPTEVRLNEQVIAQIEDHADGERPAGVDIGPIAAPQNVLVLNVTTPVTDLGDSPYDWLGQVWLDIESQ